MPNTALPYRLRLPGPVPVPERVQKAIARHIVNHRGPEFRAMYARVQELARPVFGTSSPILFFAASGTGAMEAALANIAAPGEAVLVGVHGQFGERFANIARGLNIKVDVVEVPWGEPITPALLAPHLEAKQYRALAVTHNESSTGIVNDLRAIGELTRGRDTLLLVDSVSGLGGIEMRQDEWGIDIVVSASQKALMCPPGLGLVSLNEKARAVIQRADLPRFYWDLRKALASHAESETAFTPAISLIAGLAESLAMMHEEGLANVLRRHHRLSTALRGGCAALGLRPFGTQTALSNTVVVVNVPEGTKAGDLTKRMYERHHTVIAGSRNKMAGTVVRIGVLGNVNQNDVLTDLRYLEDCLQDMNVKVTPGAGVAAATKLFEAPAQHAGARN